MTIEISNCHECPFCNYDNEYGRDQCNLSDMVDGENPVSINRWDELPFDTVHYRCPLKHLNQVTIKIKNK